MRNRSEALRGLYAVTPESADTAGLLRQVEACLAGGARLVQYRAKHASGGLALEQARALRAACRAAHALFIVNDSVALAAAVGADGVHLGREDALPHAARERLPDAIIGISCYADPRSAAAARGAGADYVAIGSVFPSTTKPVAAHAPLEAIARARAASGLPVCAIGGITPANAAQVVAAGADMIAVIGALFEAPDTREAARALASVFATQEDLPDVRT